MSKTYKLEMSIPNQRGRSQPMLGKRRSQKRARRLPLDAGVQELKAAVKYTRLDLGKDPTRALEPWKTPWHTRRKRNVQTLNTVPQLSVGFICS
jgi:hypothetical protein